MSELVGEEASFRGEVELLVTLWSKVVTEAGCEPLITGWQLVIVVVSFTADFLLDVPKCSLMEAVTWLFFIPVEPLFTWDVEKGVHF